LAHKIII